MNSPPFQDMEKLDGKVIWMAYVIFLCNLSVAFIYIPKDILAVFQLSQNES